MVYAQLLSEKLGQKHLGLLSYVLAKLSIVKRTIHIG